jgi:hypothetical protein
LEKYAATLAAHDSTTAKQIDRHLLSDAAFLDRQFAKVQIERGYRLDGQVPGH